MNRTALDQVLRLLIYAGVSLLGFVVVFICGLFKGSFIRFDTEICPAHRLPRPDVVEHLLPLTNRCVWNDGSYLDLVPAWVNPSLVLFAVLTVGFFGRAVVVVYRLRRPA